MRDDDVSEPDVPVVVGVVGHAARHADEEDVVDLLECAEQSCGRVSGRGHRFPGVADRGQLGAHYAVCADVA